MTSRIAYFVNRYPAVSHSFIRREILALEQLGFEVMRVALRGWEGELVDEADFLERSNSRYVLRQGPFRLAMKVATRLLKSPRLFFEALWLALRMGWRGARPMPYHLGYFVEACGLLPWLEEYGATHVHAHFGTNSAEIVMLARALGGPPYSFTVHGPEEFDLPRPLGLGEKVRRAAFVVAITSYARAQLYRWVEHMHWGKIKVVRCGLEADYFLSGAGPFPTARRFVCIGRLNEQKGQLLLLEAARVLAAKGIEFKLVLVGSGEMYDELQSLVQTYGLQQRVEMTGAIDSARLREEILQARALVLPSFAEGLPMVIMEAMALRRPVLTTYVAGIPELVRSGENGWLIPAGSVDALVSAMEQVLELGPDELQAMGDAAWSRVKELHSVDSQARDLGKLIGASSMRQDLAGAAQTLRGMK